MQEKFREEEEEKEEEIQRKWEMRSKGTWALARDPVLSR